MNFPRYLLQVGSRPTVASPLPDSFESLRVRLVNFSVLLGGTISLVIAVLFLSLGHPPLFAFWFLLVLALAPVFLLNRAGHHNLAASWLLLIGNILFGGSHLLLGSESHFILFYICLISDAFLIFRLRQWPWLTGQLLIIGATLVLLFLGPDQWRHPGIQPGVIDIFRVFIPASVVLIEISFIVYLKGIYETAHNSMLRKRERLNAETEFSDTVFDVAGSVLLVLNTEARLVRANLAFRQVTGYREELPTDPIWEWLIPPEIRGDIASTFEKLLTTSFFSEYENEILTREGERRLFTWQNRSIRAADGKVEYIVASGTDITQRQRELETIKHHNSLIETLLNSADQSIGIVDEDGQIELINQFAARAFGASPKEMQGKNILDYISEEVGRPRLEEVRRVCREGKPSVKTDYRQGRYIEIAFYPIFESDNTVRRVVNIARDVTAQKELEVKLRAAKEAADAANSAKDGFLSHMSHELRTPLNAILGFAQLMQTDPHQPLTPEQADNIREIHDAGRHLNLLVDELLDLTRLESGGIPVNRTLVDAGQIGRECVEILSLRAREQEIDFQLDLTGNLEIRTDERLFRQILIILLGNAVKFNRDRGEVRLMMVREDDWLRVEVADTGHGIAPKNLRKIFEAFYREKRVETGDGMGIGLALCQRYVDLLRGTIEAQSEAAGGARFQVRLPAF